jgi:hypothetical protein
MRINKPNEEIPISEYVSRKLYEIENEIKTLDNEYIMNVNQEEYINMLVAKHTVSFEVYYLTERLYLEGKQEKQEYVEEWPGFYGHNMIRRYTEFYFCLKYKFTGDIDVLRIKPECFRFSTLYNPIPIDVIGDELLIRFSSRDIDTKVIQKQIAEIKGNGFGNLENQGGAKWHINLFNERMPQEIKKIFERIKAEKEKEHRVLIELGVVNLFSTAIEVPIIRKIVPTPCLIEDRMVAYHLNDDIYKDILKHIYSLCKEYERHESIYKGKHEEDLRDLIVPSLNSVFIGTNSTAETFNRKGKTDIITKAPDNSIVFIAECKVWHGEKMLSEAIDQLLGYVTWRDTRTALILFVKNSGLLDVIEKAKSTISQHNCYAGYKGQTGDSSFSYIYHTKDDPQSNISIELMLFHYPE